MPIATPEVYADMIDRAKKDAMGSAALDEVPSFSAMVRVIARFRRAFNATGATRGLGEALARRIAALRILCAAEHPQPPCRK